MQKTAFRCRYSHARETLHAVCPKLLKFLFVLRSAYQRRWCSSARNKMIPHSMQRIILGSKACLLHDCPLLSLELLGGRPTVPRTPMVKKPRQSLHQKFSDKWFARASDAATAWLNMGEGWLCITKWMRLQSKLGRWLQDPTMAKALFHQLQHQQRTLPASRLPSQDQSDSTCVGRAGPRWDTHPPSALATVPEKKML